MFGNHRAKRWLTNQAVLAFSSGEPEYYALVKAASVSIGIQAIASELGIKLGAIELNSDASVAIGISNRIGSGKVRDIELTQLWLQEKVSQKTIVINKVGTDENLADALTKGVDAAAIAKHCAGVGIELRSDRHPIAPAIEGNAEGAEIKMPDE